MFKQIEERTTIDPLEGDIHEIIESLEFQVNQLDWDNVLSACIEEEWYDREGFDTVLVVTRMETQEDYDTRIERERDNMARRALDVRHGLALEEAARRDEINELYGQIRTLENYDES